MPVPTTGPVSFLDLSDQLGGGWPERGGFLGSTGNPLSLSELYKGQAVVPTNVATPNNIPVGGQISTLNTRGAPADQYWSQWVSPALSPWGNGVSTPKIFFATWLPEAKRQTGDTVTVQFTIRSDSSWIYPSASIVTLNCRIGYGDLQVQTPYAGRKQIYLRAYYIDLERSVYCYSFYAGANTSSPNGGSYLSALITP